MVNLFFMLFCSLCLQVGAAIPYELVPTENTILLIQEIRNACLQSQDAGCLFFADKVQDYGYSEMPYYIELGSNGANNYRICFPSSEQNSSLTSSCTSTWYMISNGVILCNIRWVNYTVFWYNSDTHTLSSSQNRETSTAEVVVPYRDGEGRTSLIALNGDIRDSSDNVIIYYSDYIQEVPGGDDQTHYNNLGALTLGGHSSGGSPLDTIGGTSFSPISGTLSVSGHSVSIGSGVANYDFTNATQNLLGQIVNNTNTLIGHSSAMYDALHSINDNVVSSATSLFNAVSVMNDNFISSITVNEEVIDEFWEESNAKQTFDAIGSFQDTLGDKVNDYVDYFEEGAQQKENELTIDIDLRNWSFSSEDYGNITPMNRIYTMRFPFLDETKALWQPFLLGLLYFALVTNIYFDFPNILRGAVR